VYRLQSLEGGISLQANSRQIVSPGDAPQKHQITVPITRLSGVESRVRLTLLMRRFTTNTAVSWKCGWIEEEIK